MSTFTRRLPVTLLNAENITTARRYRFGDWAYSDNNQHTITGTLTAGDTLAVRIVTEANHVYNGTDMINLGNNNPPTIVTVVATASISPISTTDFCYALDGPIQAIEIQKTGTAGVATVIVM